MLTGMTADQIDKLLQFVTLRPCNLNNCLNALIQRIRLGDLVQNLCRCTIENLLLGCAKICGCPEARDLTIFCLGTLVGMPADEVFF